MRRWIPLLLTVTLTVVGCRSRVTGNEGNLEFSYVADDDVNNFNKPIAVGAKLELKVAENATHKTVQLTKATSSAPTVLEVESFASDLVVLLGAGSGSAAISVEAKVPDGSTKPDTVNMLARVPEVLKLSHSCTTLSEAQYLVNQDILLTFDMEMKNGQAVIGYGFHPVTFTPADGLVLNKTTKDQQFLHLKTAATKQLVTVGSTIDSASLKLQLLTEGDIDGASMGATPAATKVNTTGFYHVLASSGGKPICQSLTDFLATGTSPTTCEVSNVGAPTTTTGPKNEYGWVKVIGKAAGTCTFNVSYSKAKAGAGMTLPMSVTISAS